MQKSVERAITDATKQKNGKRKWKGKECVVANNSDDNETKKSLLNGTFQGPTVKKQKFKEKMISEPTKAIIDVVIDAAKDAIGIDYNLKYGCLLDHHDDAESKDDFMTLESGKDNESRFD